MGLKVKITQHTLNFRFQAKTSRGAITSKEVWFIKIFDSNNESVFGLGECSPLAGLSIDAVPDYETTLKKIALEIEKIKAESFKSNFKAYLDEVIPDNYPSIKFGFEIAAHDFMNGGKRIIFPNAFSEGNFKIPINGLIWMGDQLFMLKQIREKVKQKFNCIKIKIGGIEFKKEIGLLDYIREQFAQKDIMIRLDANGAFDDQEAMEKLEILSEFKIHSIEQPVSVGKYELMRKLIEQNIIPVALDEELIGIQSREEKVNLLKELKPHYIILKPSLLGGIEATKEWISIAESYRIGWWITSALESNVGLNAIAQFTAEYPIQLHQGLGTGQLYQNNIASPLEVKNGFLQYNQDDSWEENTLNFNN